MRMTAQASQWRPRPRPAFCLSLLANRSSVIHSRRSKVKSLGEDKLREFVKYGSFKLRFQTKFHLSQEIYFVDTFTLLIQWVPLRWSSVIWSFRVHGQFFPGPERNGISYNKISRIYGLDPGYMVNFRGHWGRYRVSHLLVDLGWLTLIWVFHHLFWISDMSDSMDLSWRAAASAGPRNV